MGEEKGREEEEEEGEEDVQQESIERGGRDGKRTTDSSTERRQRLGLCVSDFTIPCVHLLDGYQACKRGQVIVRKSDAGAGGRYVCRFRQTHWVN